MYLYLELIRNFSSCQIWKKIELDLLIKYVTNDFCHDRIAARIMYVIMY